MKIKDRKVVMVLTMALLGVSACGGIEVGLDDETIDLAECLRNDDCESNSDSDNSTDSDDANDEESGSSVVDQGDGTNAGDEETGGGVVVSEYHRVDGAYFLGTYQSMDYHTDYYDVAGECDYNFPATIRGYSHDDAIDFETQSGDLAFTATIYPDETFDFSAQFQNSLGQPTIEVTCTCEMEEGMTEYFADWMLCGCESNDSEGLCLRYWESL